MLSRNMSGVLELVFTQTSNWIIHQSVPSFVSLNQKENRAVLKCLSLSFIYLSLSLSSLSLSVCLVCMFHHCVCRNMYWQSYQISSFAPNRNIPIVIRLLWILNKQHQIRKCLFVSFAAKLSADSREGETQFCLDSDRQNVVSQMSKKLLHLSWTKQQKFPFFLLLFGCWLWRISAKHASGTPQVSYSWKRKRMGLWTAELTAAERWAQDPLTLKICNFSAQRLFLTETLSESPRNGERLLLRTSCLHNRSVN